MMATYSPFSMSRETPRSASTSSVPTLYIFQRFSVLINTLRSLNGCRSIYADAGSVTPGAELRLLWIDDFALLDRSEGFVRSGNDTVPIRDSAYDFHKLLVP